MSRPTVRLVPTLAALCLLGCQPGLEAVRSALFTASQGGTLQVQRSDVPRLAGTALSIPPGALTRDTTVSVGLGSQDIAPVGGDSAAGPVVRLSPADLALSRSAVVTLPFLLGAGQSTDALVVAMQHTDGTRRVIPRQGLEVLASAGVVRFKTDRLGLAQAATDDDRSSGASQGGACQADADCSGGLHCSSHVCRVDDDPHAGSLPPGSVACSADNDCALGYECEHGACAPHGGDGDDGSTPSGGACSVDTDCPWGEECEHGACALHGGDDHGGGSTPSGGACSVDADCGAGLECEHGACAPHGG